MSKTEENLKEAFAGESQASMRYQAFAEKADSEGFPGAARLFRAASRAEQVHAFNHLRAMQGIRETEENLQTAVHGEAFEFKEMYPAMVKDSVADNEIEARHSFEYAMSIEMVHHKLFQKALESESENASANFYVCPTCGHTVRGKAPKKCPYCGVDGTKFMEIT
ncbi:rubrerythrin family protein [Desulfomonile tiedjei]|uniref:Rubrerythrin n=1 Tax=Desulfomonile tiedjei (strain ATCC 49306 / DSM 6799 / DCB-1) TaxID=706587 RepID=I4C590_DESTA|nr:rubrerythrin family protein [Desulfomonile tiedjei]AFM24731.1 rubrerythrin [Desulfomonile tiedjei DSM 6799]